MEYEKIQKVFYILGDKAEKVAAAVGYGEEEIGSPEYLRFERAWEDYLSTIGVERATEDTDFYIIDERVWIPDPHNTGKWVLIAEETADRILMLGLP